MKAGNFSNDSMDKKIAALGLSADPANYSGMFKDMGDSFNTAMDDVGSYIDEISKDLIAISQGDLTTEITREYVGDFSNIKESLNKISTTLHKTMSEISAASEHVLAGASQISISANDLADGAHEQANSVEELTATIEIISQQTRQNADNAVHANDLSGKSSHNAQEGNEAMKQMVDAMTRIKESSADISKIVKTIQDIAFQTNLLALNASVEAARAGEHGRGFSVVADEVRNLAGRSQQSASDTTAIVDEDTKFVMQGMEAASRVVASFDTIASNINEVSQSISHIADIANEQLDSIQNVNNMVSEINNVVMTTSATSEEAAAASLELSSQADALKAKAAFFKLR